MEICRVINKCRLFLDEQKGCMKRLRGTKDHLLIDKTLLIEEPEFEVLVGV